MDDLARARALVPYQPHRDATFTEQEFDCIVAAILSSGTFGAEGWGARTAAKRYAETLALLRDMGGAVDPKLPK
jgi:hypothetical protein